ncbi:hypothetical protein [Phyllobacterium sp. K27]
MAILIRLLRYLATFLQRLTLMAGRDETANIAKIIGHLNDREDLHLAKREIRAVRGGTSNMTSLSDVMKRYGIEG